MLIYHLLVAVEPFTEVVVNSLVMLGVEPQAAAVGLAGDPAVVQAVGGVRPGVNQCWYCSDQAPTGGALM